MSFGVALTAFIHAHRDVGVSLYCLGLQALSHWMTSLLLLLRMITEFHIARSTAGTDYEALINRTRRRAMLSREQILSISMALVMLLGSCALLFKALRKIRFWDDWYRDHWELDDDIQWTTQFLAVYGSVIYGVQAVTRGVVWYLLREQFIIHAGVASVASLLFLFVLAIASFYEAEWSWKAEPVAASVLAFMMIGEGIRIVYINFHELDDAHTG